MRSGSFFKYYNDNSIIHSMNPLCKLLGLMIFMVMTLLGSNVRVICCLFLVLLFIVALSNISFMNYLRPLYGIKFILFLVFLISIIFGFSVYNGFIMICKICLVIMYFSVLLYTTTTDELFFGFSSLFRPLSLFGLSVTRCSMVVALFLKFISNLFLESDRITKSQFSRGFDYKRSFRNRILGIKYSLIPMFISSIKRSNSMFDIMEVKSFNSTERSYLCDYSWHLSDFYMITCHLMVFVFILVKEVVM